MAPDAFKSIDQHFRLAKDETFVAHWIPSGLKFSSTAAAAECSHACIILWRTPRAQWKELKHNAVETSD